MTNFEWMLKNDNKTLADLIDGKWNCLYCAYALECSKFPSRCKGCKDGTIEWLLAERNYDWKKEVLTRNDIKRAMNAAYGSIAMAEAERNKPKTTADLEETIANLKKILKRKEQIAQYNEAAKGLKDLYDSYIAAGFKEYQAEMLLMEQFKAALMNNKKKEK